MSELTGTRTRGSIERKGLSQYKISYQYTIKGQHQLHINVEGQHIIAEAEEHVGGRNKMGNLRLWISFGIPLLCTHKLEDIFTLKLMKVTHEKIHDFQPILVNFWCGNRGGGGGRKHIL